MQTWTRQETKAELPDGPWQQEPDKAVWIDAATDLDCMIHRGPSGALCGYVGVPTTHPLYGYHYDQPMVVCRHEKPDLADDHPLAEMLKRLEEMRKRDGKTYEQCWDCPRPESFIDVHGGLTYSNSCQPLGEENHGICHVPAPGRPHDIWWFGFDCAHLGDVAPKYDATMDNIIKDNPRTFKDPYNTYKDFAYVQAEVANLAKQIKAFTP